LKFLDPTQPHLLWPLRNIDAVCLYIISTRHCTRNCNGPLGCMFACWPQRAALMQCQYVLLHTALHGDSQTQRPSHSVECLRRDSRWVCGKQQPTWCMHKTQDSSPSKFPWQRRCCTIAYACCTTELHWRACAARICAFFMAGVALNRCPEQVSWVFMAGVALNRCPEHQCIYKRVRYTGVLTSAYTFANTFAAGCAHALLHAQFVDWHWMTRVGGVS